MRKSEVKQGATLKELQEQGLYHGTGQCPMHAGELIQGATTRTSWPKDIPALSDGLRRIFVLTHPMPIHGSSARFELNIESTRVVPVPNDRKKALVGAELALRYLGISVGGTLRVHNTFDRLGLDGKGWGCGTSTSDVVAAIRAVHCAVTRMVEKNQGQPPIYVDPVSLKKLEEPRTIASLVFQAEGPCDALPFYPSAIFWFSRNGRVLAPLYGEHDANDASCYPFPFTLDVLESRKQNKGSAHLGAGTGRTPVDLRIGKDLTYPRFRCVTFCIDRKGVDTAEVQLLHEYSPDEILEYDTLIGEAFEAMKHEKNEGRAAQRLAAVATRSASMQREVLIRTRNFPDSLYIEDFLWTWLHQIKQDFGALGLSVAHSGTVASLLFPFEGDRVIEMQRNAARKIREYGFDPVWQYSFGGADNGTPELVQQNE